VVALTHALLLANGDKSEDDDDSEEKDEEQEEDEEVYPCSPLITPTYFYIIYFTPLYPDLPLFLTMLLFKSLFPTKMDLTLRLPE
jgi:hypothetical protein